MDTPEVQEVVKLLQEQLAKFGDDKSTSILLAFAEGLPSAGARLLCSEIRCLDVSRRQELAQTLLYAILLPMRERSKTPTPIDSRLAWLDDFAETTSDDRPDSTSKSSHQKLRADCLRRDSKKCLITGFSDLKSLSPEESQAVFSVRTECAHILPFSLGSHAEATHRVTVDTWNALYRYYPTLERLVDSSEIYGAGNGLTLWTEAYYEFRHYRLGLVVTNKPNTYRIETYGRVSSVLSSYLPTDRIVTFTTDTDVPLPDSRLLETHAAIASILHLSAMGEYIDEIMQDREDLRYLATDGSTNIERLLMVF